jgi:hypothetical protein
VECAFGILSNTWRIFQRQLNVSPDFAVDIVKACFVLRFFFFCERGGCKFEDAMIVNRFEDVSDGQSIRGGLIVNNLRNKVADYFLTDDGAVP